MQQRRRLSKTFYLQLLSANSLERAQWSRDDKAGRLSPAVKEWNWLFNLSLLLLLHDQHFQYAIALNSGQCAAISEWQWQWWSPAFTLSLFSPFLSFFLPVSVFVFVWSELTATNQKTTSTSRDKDLLRQVRDGKSVKNSKDTNFQPKK